MNSNLIHFEKIKKIQLFYPSKYTFISYNEIIDSFRIKLNDTFVDVSKINLKSRYTKQIKFETVIFLWLEKEGYIKNFSKNYQESIIPSEDYCRKNEIELIRHYLVEKE